MRLATAIVGCQRQIEIGACPPIHDTGDAPMLKRTAILTLLAFVCAATVPAQASRPESVSAKDVANEVLSYTRFTVFDDVSIGVDGGVVTLTGKVTQPYKAGDIERRIARLAGVQLVRNEIQVLPVSPFDDNLRFHLARAIYGNPAFWRYAAMANPPIHILVEDGRVTLTGVVNNNVERMLAYSLASSSPAFSIRNELKTDGEMRALQEKTE
jgi:hyperosmotically inducible periplasmic protein